jgi:hypothetical protein
MEDLERKYSLALRVATEIDKAEPQSMQDVADTLELVRRIYSVRFTSVG